MKEFDDLLHTTERLLGPGGCPWDQEQTMASTRAGVLEEVCELIEAIDLEDNEHITEELGDLFFNAVFLCKLAEKENRSSLAKVLRKIDDKLISRHPHVFGEVEIKTSDQVLHQWEEIKKKEKGKEDRASVLDGIPKGLPALSRAVKVLKKISKSRHAFQLPHFPDFEDEESFGDFLLSAVEKAREMGIDAEQALRAKLAQLEEAFRSREAVHN